MEAFTKTPWINFDQIDDKGIRAEVQVTEGVGRIESFEKSKGGKAYTVHFGVDNQEYGATGHLPIDDPLVEPLKEAFENGDLMGFRIERWRQQDVDRSIPLEVLFPKNDLTAGKKGFKGLVAIYPDLGIEKQPKGGNALRSPKMRTRFEEDPMPTSAGDPYDVDLEVFSGKPAAGTSVTPPIYHASIEPSPYVDRHGDGGVNIGSISVGVADNILTVVERFCKENDVLLSEEDQMTVAIMILRMANTLQIKMYNKLRGEELKSPSLGTASHARARKLIFDQIEKSFPITEDLTSKEAFKSWGKGILSEAQKRWEWSYNAATPFIGK